MSCAATAGTSSGIIEHFHESICKSVCLDSGSSMTLYSFLSYFCLHPETTLEAVKTSEIVNEINQHWLTVIWWSSHVLRPTAKLLLRFLMNLLEPCCKTCAKTLCFYVLVIRSHAVWRSATPSKVCPFDRGTERQKYWETAKTER